MGSRLTDLPGGVLVPGRCTLSTLAAVGAGTTDSTYTEATPRPGSPVPGDGRNQLQVEHSGGQGTDYRLAAIRAGNPGRDKGVSLAYRLEDDTSADWRGWNPPSFLSAWYSVAWVTTGSGDDYTRKGVATVPSTQLQVVAFRDLGNARCQVVSIDDDLTLTTGDTVADGASWNYPAVCVLPSERVLVLYGGTIYYTDDDGVTLATYSTDPLDGTDTSTFTRTRIRCAGGDILLLVTDGSDILQFASSDFGASFQLVDTLTSWGSHPEIMEVDGAFYVTYIKTSDSKIYGLRLASAWEPISRADADEVAITTGAASAKAATNDPDGTLWLVYSPTGGDRDMVEIWVCYDGGLTWTQCDGRAMNLNSAADYLENMLVTAARGELWVYHSWVASTAGNDASIAALVLGGWSTVTMGPPAAINSWAYEKRVGSAVTTDGTNRVVGETWIPIELPESLSSLPWTAVGAGTSALGTAVMTITTAANSRYYTIPDTAVASTNAVIMFADMTISAGGSLTADDVAVRLRLADGVFDYDVSVRFDATGYRVYDNNAAAQLGSDQAVSTLARVQVMMRLAEGTFECFHRRVGSTDWTVGPSGSVTNDSATPDAASQYVVGNIASATATSNWHTIWYTSTSFPGYEPDLFQGVSQIYGRHLAPQAIPIPDLGTSTEYAWLAAVGGPARMADQLTVAAEHDYPVDHAFVEVAPSPAVTWRSQDLTQAELVFDLGLNSRVGDAFGLYIANANFRTAYLDYYDGAAWQTAGTLDLATGMTSLEWVRVGDIIGPGSPTTDADRWLWRNELAGGHAVLGGGKNRHIAHNQAGAWQASGSVVPQVRLEDVDGTEGASGSCELVSPSGLLVVYPTAAQLRRYWRVRIPNQQCPDTYFEAGAIMVGEIVPWGARVDWTRSEQWTPNVTSWRDLYGTIHARQEGPPAREWTVSWQSATDHRGLRASIDADYVGTTTGLALTGAEDVAYLVAGLLEELRGGEWPCVVIEELPTSTGVITDPTRYLYGRIISPHRANGVLGTLGEDEVQRIESLTISEVV